MLRYLIPITVVFFSLTTSRVIAQKSTAEYYQIKVFQFATASQEQGLDNYLEKALLPSLHKSGYKQIGVFKPITNDTSASKKIYVFIPSTSLEKLAELSQQLSKDAGYKAAAKDYLEAAFDKVPYTRVETMLLKAFQKAPKMKLPVLKSDKSERIYELRSYEGPTDNLYAKKVKMFNEGSEVTLFNRLGFNAIFYAEVLSGSRMPNLMYMTSFENRAERDAHWKTFFADPEWKQLSALPEYQKTVSRAEIILTKATSYSDL